MRSRGIYLLLCGLIAFAARSHNNNTGRDNRNRLEITCDDTQRHMTRKSAAFTYVGEDITRQAIPGNAGKGVTWDFSALNLEAYTYRTKVESDRKKIDYSTSLYKAYFPNATECYLAKSKITYLDDESLTTLYDYYTYMADGKDLGSVQDNAPMKAEHMVAIWHNNNPIVTIPYPQYYGLEYTMETNTALTMLRNSVQEPTEDPVTSALHIIIDGEGTLILPGGKRITDVLRYKITTSGNKAQYSYKSKELGEILSLSPDNDGYIMLIN